MQCSGKTLWAIIILTFVDSFIGYINLEKKFNSDQIDGVMASPSRTKTKGDC